MRDLTSVINQLRPTGADHVIRRVEHSRHHVREDRHFVRAYRFIESRVERGGFHRHHGATEGRFGNRAQQVAASLLHQLEPGRVGDELAHPVVTRQVLGPWTLIEGVESGPGPATEFNRLAAHTLTHHRPLPLGVTRHVTLPAKGNRTCRN